MLQTRAERWTQKTDPTSPYGVKGVLERPTEPARWPAYIFYFKPIVLLLNVLPFGVFLILYARLLDSYAANDWAWFFSLVAAAFATYLLPFTQTLNNHTVAAFSAFFALHQVVAIWSDEERSGWRFAAAGFFAAFAVANELPALAFLVLLLAVLFVSYPRPTLLCFIPGAAVPIAAFIAAHMRCLASSSWPMRRSARTNTFSKEASGKRRWTLTRSMNTPSRMRRTFSI